MNLLVAACDHHHHLLHDEGWTIEVDLATGRHRWCAPDGRSWPGDQRGLGLNFAEAA